MNQPGKTVMRGDLSVDSRYRNGLPPIPKRMISLPVDRGYPVPWFVVKARRGVPCPDNDPVCEVQHLEEYYDFRVADGGKWAEAVNHNRCWLCGETLGRYKVFVLGPMCVVTRTTTEPASHLDCAKFAMLACPFLTQQTQAYRDGNLPEGVREPAGEAIKRQPGVSALWWTEKFSLFDDGGGRPLISVGDPFRIEWWTKGRLSLRTEIHESMGSGLPTLYEMALPEGYKSILGLNEQVEKARQYIDSNPWVREEA